MSRPAAALAAVSLAFASCSTFRKVNVYSVPQEMAVGEVFSSEIEALYPILQDPRLDWYLNHRGRMLADLSDRRDIPYTFNVVDSPELNAFAIPGGHIYINLGMIEACQNENELIALMAHEIGHVIAKHSMKQLSQQTIIQIVGTIALNQYPNQWAALAANLFTITSLLKMSRDAEAEADRIGLELMLRAGYDPKGMSGIFGNLLRKHEENPGLLDKLFLTHPPTRERIAAVDTNLGGRKLPPDLLVTTPEYRAAYDHLVKTYYSDAGRKRWKDFLAQKDDEDKKDADRLPWDTKSDEAARKRKAKEKEKRERERKKREAEVSPTPTPGPEATPAPPDVELPPAAASSPEPVSMQPQPFGEMR